MVNAKEQFVLRRLQQFRQATRPVFDGKNLWYFNPREGIYVEDSDKGHFFRNQMADHPDAWKREVVTLLKDGAYEPGVVFNHEKTVIATKDCYVDIATGERIKFNPSHRMTRKLPVFFDPDADCPNINALLDHHLSQQDKETLYEYLGYSLYEGMDLKAMLWVQGEPNTRKSTFFIETLHKFFGEFISQLDIHDFDRQYKGRVLKNKFINIADDVSSKQLEKSNTALIKKFFGGSAEVEVDAKNVAYEPLQHKPKGIFICNKAPMPFDEDDEAFYIRANVIQFLNPVPPAMNTTFVEQYTTKEELSGLLNEMILGYQRLIARGSFVYQKNKTVMRSRYELVSKGATLPQPSTRPAKLQSYI